MSSSTQRLELLRREIDVIDSAIHDLIVKRATIVEDIREIKGGAGPALRPGREAEILRRLAARHKGALPLAGVICVWREMVSAFTHLQDPFSVSVYAPAGRERLTAVARDHFGSLTQLMPVSTASAAVRAVGDGTAAAAVLPLPEDGEGDAWWPLLVSGDGRAPRIIARLPFLSDGKGEQALVIGAAPRDLSSGDETSLVAIELDEGASRSRVLAAAVAAGFESAAGLGGIAAEGSRTFHLIEVAGAVAADDPRLGALRGQFGPSFSGAHLLGGYARQLVRGE